MCTEDTGLYIEDPDSLECGVGSVGELVTPKEEDSMNFRNDDNLSTNDTASHHRRLDVRKSSLACSVCVCVCMCR